MWETSYFGNVNFAEDLELFWTLCQLLCKSLQLCKQIYDNFRDRIFMLIRHQSMINKIYPTNC
jgi:hypothetical protein